MIYFLLLYNNCEGLANLGLEPRWQKSDMRNVGCEKGYTELWIKYTLKTDLPQEFFSYVS